MSRCYYNSDVPKPCYEWHLNDEYSAVLRKAKKFREQKESLYGKRHWLAAFLLRSNQILKDSVDALRKSYVNDLSARKSPENCKDVARYLTFAGILDDPILVLLAYTSTQMFSSWINSGMAQNTYHELTLYCTPLNCHLLSCKQDGIQAFTTILFHPNLKKFRCTGDITVYRGAVLCYEDVLKGYAEGSIIITTTFLSTSKDIDIAKGFFEPNPHDSSQLSLLCTYRLHNYRHTAIDIEKFSLFSCEKEILLYPYVPFRIVSFEKTTEPSGIRRWEVTLEELADDVDGNVNQSEQAVTT